MSNIVVIKSVKKQTREKVCAYCRVSTKYDEQLSSLSVQKTYYENMITKNENYELVGIFSDEGISGTSISNRKNFNIMLEKCKNGEIDIIITKSISRFSRNLKDFLTIINLLRDYNVSVIFENENINTKNDESQFMMSIFSSIAQEESINISKNIKWQIQSSFKNGSYVPKCVPYGYYVKNGEICVDNEKKEIVELIFSMYIDGYSAKKIAQYLTDIKAVPKFNKNLVWSYRTVIEIIKNEFYKGSLIMQKSYTKDVFPPKSVKNNGEKDMYYIENSHIAIISKEDFEKANIIRKGKKLK